MIVILQVLRKEMIVLYLVVISGWMYHQKLNLIDTSKERKGKNKIIYNITVAIA